MANKKMCSPCHEKVSTAFENWKRKRMSEPVPEGKRICSKCIRHKPIDQFISVHGKQLTRECKNCWRVMSKSQRNPTTATGKCRELYMN